MAPALSWDVKLSNDGSFVEIGQEMTKLGGKVWKKSLQSLRAELQSLRAESMGAIHKMAATLGDSPTARSLPGNFSSQRSLPHLAEHFFLDFLVLLRAKRPHTNENLFGSTSPSRHKADFCFHRSEKSLREPLRLASVSNL